MDKIYGVYNKSKKNFNLELKSPVRKKQGRDYLTKLVMMLENGDLL